MSVARSTSFRSPVSFSSLYHQFVADGRIKEAENKITVVYKTEELEIGSINERSKKVAVNMLKSHNPVEFIFSATDADLSEEDAVSCDTRHSIDDDKIIQHFDVLKDAGYIKHGLDSNGNAQLHVTKVNESIGVVMVNHEDQMESIRLAVTMYNQDVSNSRTILKKRQYSESLMKPLVDYEEDKENIMDGLSKKFKKISISELEANPDVYENLIKAFHVFIGDLFPASLENELVINEIEEVAKASLNENRLFTFEQKVSFEIQKKVLLIEIFMSYMRANEDVDPIEILMDIYRSI
jgi:hypothetical protein